MIDRTERFTHSKIGVNESQRSDELGRLQAAASQDTHGDLVPPTLRPDRPVRAGC